MEKLQINEALKDAIVQAHERAEHTTADARHHMDTAINNRIMCASLIEKAREMHKQDLLTWLADTPISGKMVKAYLSLHDASKKRAAIHDKRQLLLCGILEAQDEQPRIVSTVKPSVINTASTFIGRFNKVVGQRPVTEWDQSEREQVKDVLAPVVEFYNSL